MSQASSSTSTNDSAASTNFFGQIGLRFFHVTYSAGCDALDRDSMLIVGKDLDDVLRTIETVVPFKEIEAIIEEVSAGEFEEIYEVYRLEDPNRSSIAIA